MAAGGWLAAAGVVSDEHQVTAALAAWSAGDREALPRLLPLLYDELRALAAQQLRRERGGHTLQPTALVNELFLRLAGRQVVQLEARAQFFAIAAQAMRRILVDHARRRRAARRGGGQVMETLELAAARELRLGPEPVEVLALDGALQKLERLDPRQARVVELKFFADLQVDEIAAALGVANVTVRRDWSMARAWLRRELLRGAGEAGAGGSEEAPTTPLEPPGEEPGG